MAPIPFQDTPADPAEYLPPAPDENINDDPADSADSAGSLPEPPSGAPAPAVSGDLPLITVTLSEHEYTNVSLRFGLYDDPDNLIPVLQLYSDEGMGLEPLATVTVNVPDWGPEDGCILVKDWSENEGMMASLVDAGVLEDTGFSLAVNEWGSLAYQGRVLPPFAAELERVMTQAEGSEA